MCNNCGRCFPDRPWISSTSGPVWWKKMSSLVRITLPYWHGATLCSYWIGSLGWNIGLWKIQYGMNFVLETDHKPLQTLLNTTELSKTPPRIQRFRWRLTRFNDKVQYVPGKHQITADALSRAPVALPTWADEQLVQEAENLVTHKSAILPATTNRLQEIRETQTRDEECAQVKTNTACKDSQPICQINPCFVHTWKTRPIYRNSQLYPQRPPWYHKVPRQSPYIGLVARTFNTCAKDRPEPKEPLIASSFPSCPWERLGMDLFELDGKVYTWL